jgi:hypothetical protein
MQAIYQRMQKDFCLLIAHDKTAISNRNFVVEDVFCLVGPPPPEKLTGDISSSGALRPISPSCRSWCGDRGSSDVPALHHVACQPAIEKPRWLCGASDANVPRLY